MTFEEQFPSLQSSSYRYRPIMCSTGEPSVLIKISKGTLQEFCIDKQKVREAIESNKLLVEINGSMVYVINPNNLTEELGL